MATSINVDSADVAAAASILQQFMTDEVPTGDFTSGTALHDLAVGALAALYAFLRGDAAQVRQMQSLATAAQATGGDTQALSDAVTAILSNFFVKPKNGSKSRGFVIGHASQQVDLFIPTTARFTRSAGLVFVVDASDTLFVPKAALVPIVDAGGGILDYEFRIPLVAIQTGEAYDIDPGLFASFDAFSPYVSRVENTVKFSGGKGPETVAEILVRAPTAVSVRNLINDRSIAAVLDDTFADIQSLLVVGMGDPEMQRDRVPGIAPNLAFHVGGMVDIYLRTGLVETEATGTVGDLFERPDGLATMFRDSAVSFASVEEGDILRITAGLPVVPTEHMVIRVVDTHTLEVSERAPFAVATDEASPIATVSYTIGRIGPAYTDVVADVGGAPFTTGLTSRRVSTSGRVTLPGGPVMDILDVAILNPPGPEAAFKSNLDGYVHFPNHVDTTPSQAQTPTQGLQFQTIVNNPLYAQSALQWMEIVVGTDTSQARFDGLSLRVRYRTLAAFASIDNFVRGTGERVLAAFQLPRGHHPVVLRMDISYELKATAKAALSNPAIAQTVADFITQFDTTATPIDVSAVVQKVKDTYPDIGTVFPFTIQYDLRAPTGDVLQYETADKVVIDPAKQTSGPSLALPDFGVTSRTLRYLANSDGIRPQQVG